MKIIFRLTQRYIGLQKKSDNDHYYAGTMAEGMSSAKIKRVYLIFDSL